jgi:serine/threonine-protein kinase
VRGPSCVGDKRVVQGEGVAVDTFGRYRLDALLGRGGMGEVWRAYDTVKERVVALKRLPPQMAENAEFQTRFKREARIAAQLREPHIIPIHDFGVIDGQLFIDMRLVDGVDLASALAQFGPLHPVRAVEIVTQIASALDAAHDAGLVHRDVKPSNVLLAGPGPERDFIYLIDFGLAHAADDARITYTGASVGTPAYLAPERYLGHGDHRADIYALGGLLHTMLTGANPFPGDGPTQMYAHIHTPPPSPSQQRPELQGGLDEVVATAMAKNPDHRYPTASALATAAHTALKTPTRTVTTCPNRFTAWPPTHIPLLRIEARRKWLVLLGAGLTVALITTAIIMFRPGSTTSGTNPIITGAPITLPRQSWTAVGATALQSGPDPGAFEISSTESYWAGVTATPNATCNYVFSGSARVVAGLGYGIAVRATFSGGIPSAQAFQYDPGAVGYRVTQYPTDGGSIIAASTDTAWHQFMVMVSGAIYTVQLDNVTVASGTTGLTCGGVFLRQWSGTSEFRDLRISPAS